MILHLARFLLRLELRRLGRRTVGPFERGRERFPGQEAILEQAKAEVLGR